MSSFNIINSEFNTLCIPTGEYKVGVKSIGFFDETQKEINYPEGRLIPICIYFPIEKAEHQSYQKKIDEIALDHLNILDV